MTANYQEVSTRAEVVTRRTYNRPLNDEGTVFETWEQTVDRVIGHQRWLWERQQRAELNASQENELAELRQLMIDRKATTSGRTLWLGGTDVAKTREASQFNCSFGNVETVHDVVDAQHLLLQGCGVGFYPAVGILSGFTAPVEVQVVRSEKQKSDPKGAEDNVEAFYQEGGKAVWEVVVGDSAEAWAKSFGKLVAMKKRVDIVRLNYREIRAAGMRLKGYGWISSGDSDLSVAQTAICKILNDRVGQLLRHMDILDMLNHMGTVLSSRRSAEIAVLPVTNPEIDAFISAKRNWFNLFDKQGNERTMQSFCTPEEVALISREYEDGLDEATLKDIKRVKEDVVHYAASLGFKDRAHRQQSNNSIMFDTKPTKWELSYIFDRILEAGGSEPGFINAEAARKRAPWFKGVNPCAEILLGNKSFCNLVEVDWGKFLGDHAGLEHAVWLAARANYRQTCVDLDDGILQRSWHELNEFLRLCGVGGTGIVKFLDHYTGRHNVASMLQSLRYHAHKGANSMAEEFGTPLSKAITTVKPSGTLSKIMDTTEGVHKPLGKYIINNITFSKDDPTIGLLEAAGYKVFDKPSEPSSKLVAMPVCYDDVVFDKVETDRGTVEVNLESAVAQLDRYKLLMNNYVDHNCSVTISYDPSEVPAIIEWILTNWDTYVGVSFIYRNDPTKTAEDLGYAYLPQEVITEEAYVAYTSQLKPLDLSGLVSDDDLVDEACTTGACPIR